MSASVEAQIIPPLRDIGGFGVRRALPAPNRRSIGPFVFFDEMGPADFAAGQGMDVRPHPHIGLATLTYLLDGALFHRDSLRNDQEITPGAVNLMVAGRGIVHSERSPQKFRTAGGRMAGLQFWLALSQAEAEREPRFDHFDAGQIPAIAGDGFRGRVAIGRWDGVTAPVHNHFGPCALADIALDAGAVYEIGADYEERALYLISGVLEIDGKGFAEKCLIVLKPGENVVVRAKTAARIALVAGDPMDGPRYLWWNFVSASRERIVQAREDWIAGRFLGIEGDAEFIPAPELKAL
ncbi:redox-sensitive bicupin YhaK (pirin superfamily) [Rhodoblastus acidophilus]|uniref:pirin family protein n=1 Tax=Rhodoblastus acidophilus TaxID=1074 RepID=UPI002223F1C7|nr:pirin family protein [Rhodoblastus acidophilus]MCW2286247.1 redox-sensitive bicupin YhaK (pirin superfamily) [Rhodoblastus acidophilus]MCW2335173.1 redox-sensitive bicupin YhaK (pirin superfamily) [Rhodoblastus acidophilus]